MHYNEIKAYSGRVCRYSLNRFTHTLGQPHSKATHSKWHGIIEDFHGKGLALCGVAASIDNVYIPCVCMCKHTNQDVCIVSLGKNGMHVPSP